MPNVCHQCHPCRHGTQAYVGGSHRGKHGATVAEFVIARGCGCCWGSCARGSTTLGWVHLSFLESFAIVTVHVWLSDIEVKLREAVDSGVEVIDAPHAVPNTTSVRYIGHRTIA